LVLPNFPVVCDPIFFCRDYRPINSIPCNFNLARIFSTHSGVQETCPFAHANQLLSGGLRFWHGHKNLRVHGRSLSLQGLLSCSAAEEKDVVLNDAIGWQVLLNDVGIAAHLGHIAKADPGRQIGQ